MNLKSNETKSSQSTTGSHKKIGPYIITANLELLADLDTPVSTFYKLCEKKPYSFLLESVEGNEKLGRYSIIGTEPILLFTNRDNKTYLDNFTDGQKLQLEDNPFTALNNLLKDFNVLDNGNERFLGFVGYFGYENIRWIEPKTKFNPCKKVPDVCLMLPGKLVIFDHILHKVNLISITFAKSENDIKEKHKEAKSKLETLLTDFGKSKNVAPLSINYSKNTTEVSYTSNYKKEDYIKMVIKAKEYIRSGDIFQVVPSQKLTVRGNHNGLLLYRALRSINPSPYLFYLNFNDFEIAGSSPEVMVKCEDRGLTKVASLRPIAGTYPRGKDEVEDLHNISKLLGDPKERAEHLMLVDLARNDLGRVCETGSVNVCELMIIEKYSHVLHMVSLVEGNLKKDKTAIDLLCASFPAGTLSGAPKVRALEIINELEKDQRGPYGGCTGLFGLNNTINTCMTIRTFVIYRDHLEIQAGGGIVADSDPENEYQETLRKGGALLRAMSLLQ
ncbi:MAG: chorismate-binding protein [Candidatus Melainabacteria bacterium]|nr:chorismate-binding protein [Candidatus Melainabacteria bacterium]